MHIKNIDRNSALTQAKTTKGNKKFDTNIPDLVTLGDNAQMPDFISNARTLSDMKKNIEMEQKLGELAEPDNLIKIFSAKLEDGKTDNKDILPKVNVTLDENGEAKKVSKHGMNAPVFCTTARGNVGVFKPFRVNNDPVAAEMKRKETVYEISASHIMDHFGIPTITYSEAKGDIDGKELKGVVSDFVPNKSLAQDPTLLQKINNPEVATRGIVFDAWLGNFDRMLNNSNIWIEPNGNIIFGDYGCGFRKGVTAFGMPKANLAFMNVYAKKDVVEKAIGEITSLSNEDIAKLVDDSLKYTTMEDKNTRDHMVGILIANRDELKEKNPFKPFYEKNPVTIELSDKATEGIAYTLVDKYGFDKNNPHETADKMLQETLFYKDPNAKPILVKLAGTFNEIMDNYAKGEKKAITVLPDPPEVFNGFVNVVYNNLSPQKCLELNLGLYF